MMERTDPSTGGIRNVAIAAGLAVVLSLSAFVVTSGILRAALFGAASDGDFEDVDDEARDDADDEDVDEDTEDDDEEPVVIVTPRPRGTLPMPA